MLRSYFDYYASSRTHLSLEKDAPIPRAIQPLALGRVVVLPEVGRLHHGTNAAQPDEVVKCPVLSTNSSESFLFVFGSNMVWF